MATSTNSRISVASLGPICSHFPALERRHNGQPVADFDGPGGTPVPRPVVEAMTAYLYHHNANAHWAFPTSHLGTSHADRRLHRERHPRRGGDPRWERRSRA